MKLKGKVAIVTGGARGIGFAISSRFAKEQAKVAIFDIDIFKAEEAVRKIKEEVEEAEVIALQVDVSDFDSVKKGVEQVVKKFGKIDILVNNAAIHLGKPFHEEPLEYWEKQFKINVLGTVIPSQLVVPHMIKAGGGSIVNISSKAAITGEPGHAAYSSLKGAILSLTLAMAVDLAPYKIRVNAICPGPTETDLLYSATTEEDRKRMSERAPLKRLAKPEDIASAALYFASDDSAYVTGQRLSVDGGMTIAAVERI
ncbi:MAG: SDR family oxidoreductase [Aigarchaeota archaeon]|nr:SDR family oxidoreductase [Aigarchaeota archaeon]MDW7986370.1 SDR family oxidoreductase [Nitrososphaerota archaeon]